MFLSRRGRLFGYIGLFGLLVIFGVSLSVRARKANAEEFPERAITIIVPYSAGGAFDANARQLARPLGRELGVNVIVKNVPGAGARIGAVEFQRSEPDGYTMFYSADAGLFVAQLLGNEQEYDVNTWGWVCQLNLQSGLLVTGGNSPFKTMDDVFNAKKPLRILDIGFGSGYFPQHVVFLESFNLDGRIIGGYGGTSEIIPALIRNEGDFLLMFSFEKRRGFIEKGDLRPLMVVTRKRVAWMPDVPTITEFNLPSTDLLDMESINGLAVPGETPKDRIKILQNAVEKAISDKTFLQWAGKTGFASEMHFLPSEEMDKAKRKQYRVFAKYKDDYLKYKQMMSR